MTKQDIIRKLTSRKLWLAIALFVSGLITALGKQETAETVAGLIMQAAAVIGYIVGEGLVDSNRVIITAPAKEEDKPVEQLEPVIGFQLPDDNDDDVFLPDDGDVIIG